MRRSPVDPSADGLEEQAPLDFGQVGPLYNFR